MKTSIETIGDKLCTVIWHNASSVGNFTKECVQQWRWEPLNGGGAILVDIERIATALPALPKHPKPEDAALLYRYASEGVFAVGVDKLLSDGEYDAVRYIDHLFRMKLIHAVDTEGNKLEIAIEDK